MSYSLLNHFLGAVTATLPWALFPAMPLLPPKDPVAQGNLSLSL